VYGLALGFLVSQVDNAAHLGGLAAGFALGYVIGTPRLVGSAEQMWKVAAGLCVLITFLSFGMAVLYMLRYGSQY